MRQTRRDISRKIAIEFTQSPSISSVDFHQDEAINNFVRCFDFSQLSCSFRNENNLDISIAADSLEAWLFTNALAWIRMYLFLFASLTCPSVGIWDVNYLLTLEASPLASYPLVIPISAIISQPVSLLEFIQCFLPRCNSITEQMSQPTHHVRVMILWWICISPFI